MIYNKKFEDGKGSLDEIISIVPLNCVTTVYVKAVELGLLMIAVRPTQTRETRRDMRRGGKP